MWDETEHEKSVMETDCKRKINEMEVKRQKEKYYELQNKNDRDRELLELESRLDHCLSQAKLLKDEEVQGLQAI